MVWIKTPRMEAWACFACAWAFRPSGPPVGNSLEEMMQNYELQRDNEFKSHDCAQCPKTGATRDVPALHPKSRDRNYEMTPALPGGRTSAMGAKLKRLFEPPQRKNRPYSTPKLFFIPQVWRGP
jgi:hypothetical protein